MSFHWAAISQRGRSGSPALRNILHLQADHVAAAKLAIDCEVEQGASRASSPRPAAWSGSTRRASVEGRGARRARADRRNGGAAVRRRALNPPPEQGRQQGALPLHRIDRLRGRGARRLHGRGRSGRRHAASLNKSPTLTRCADRSLTVCNHLLRCMGGYGQWIFRAQ
jgi:hypothetical protein